MNKLEIKLLLLGLGTAIGLSGFPTIGSILLLSALAIRRC